MAHKAVAFDAIHAVATKYVAAIRRMLLFDELETDGAFELRSGRGGSL